MLLARPRLVATRPVTASPFSVSVGAEDAGDLADQGGVGQRVHGVRGATLLHDDRGEEGVLRAGRQQAIQHGAKQVEIARARKIFTRRRNFEILAAIHRTIDQAVGGRHAQTFQPLHALAIHRFGLASAAAGKDVQRQQRLEIFIVC